MIDNVRNSYSVYVMLGTTTPFSLRLHASHTRKSVYLTLMEIDPDQSSCT